MKQIYALITVLMFAFTLNAQYIYNDFDENQNETLSGWPNSPTLIANPDISGINTSANVGEWVRTGEQWAHIFINLAGMVDFSTGETFYLKIWSPVACNVLFKLENQANPGLFVELSQSVTTPNTWVQLTFNFAGAASGTYDKIVIFPDFSATVNNTFYIDDLQGPEYAGGGPGEAVDLPVTFDDDNVNYALTDFGGNVSLIIVDPTNGDNKVAQTTKTAGAETWAGTTVGGAVGFANPIPFEEGFTSMTVRVWSPAAGTPIRLKVEAANDPTISVETETNTTVASDWEIMTFDFSNEAPGTAELNFDNTYNKASIFFNFGTSGGQAGEQTYYWDDMEFVGGTAEKPLLEADVQDNFENDGYGNITTWKFQDPEMLDLVITTDPVNPANHVAEYNRSGSFEYTNAQFVLDHRMDLSQRNNFELKVYFPSSNDYTGSLTPTAAIKLQNSLLGGNAWTTQTEVKLDVTALDTWVTLVFDFSAVSDRVDYDQVVVQLGGEGHLVPGLMYFDDINLMDYTFVSEKQMIETSVYPNPASSILNIDNAMEMSEIRIFSVDGQQVFQSGSVQKSVDISGFPVGIYMLKGYSADGSVYVAKFMKK
jgi:hypothetical protein